MRLRLVPATGLAVAALIVPSAASATVVPSASAQTSATTTHQSRVAGGSPFHGFANKKGCGFTNGTTDSGFAVTSQDIYDFGMVSEAADDFVCARSTSLKGVRWQGNYFDSAATAESFNIYVYADNGGEPSDTAMCSYPKQRYKSTGAPTFPQLSITKLKGGACKLRGGATYWLAIQAYMSFSADGQFGWETTSDRTGKPADWRNPDDGFGTDCTSFSQAGTGKGLDMQDCFHVSGSPDFIFSVK